MDYIKELDRRNAERRQNETMCGACNRIIGVIVLKFRSNDNAKICKHKGQDGRWCNGSGLAVPLAAIITRNGRPPVGYGNPVL